MSVATDPTPRFGVLGPLRVWRGDRVIVLGRYSNGWSWPYCCSRPVTRFAATADQRGVGGNPARRAVNLMQRHVSRLRRVLGTWVCLACDRSRLVWADAGYCWPCRPAPSTLRYSTGSCAGAGPRGRTVTCGKPPEHCITRSASGADPFATA